MRVILAKEASEDDDPPERGDVQPGKRAGDHLNRVSRTFQERNNQVGTLVLEIFSSSDDRCVVSGESSGYASGSGISVSGDEMGER